MSIQNTLVALIQKNYYVGVGLCAAGIISTLVLYGILQERIMTVPYGDRGEYFRYTLFIVCCNRLATCLVAMMVMLAKGEKLAPIAPIYTYAGVSVSNVIATSCQYEALKYVTFPVQTLAKTAKMVPVMIWSTAILFKKYSWKEYLMALAVTAGCTLFLLSGDVRSKASSTSDTASLFGGLLMFGYLGFDGFTSTFQEKLFKGYEMSSQHQVLYVTMCSSVFSFISLVSANMLTSAVSFVYEHPKCMLDIAYLSTSAVLSQFVIAYTIKEYGALVFATIMTTRQFISILVSSLLFNHPLKAMQWLGVLIVFSVLYLKIKLRSSPAPAREPNTVQTVKSNVRDKEYVQISLQDKG